MLPLRILFGLVLVFQAVTLWPEVAVPVPSLNDTAVHFLIVQRMSEALAQGDNVLDHWVPDLELGWPFPLYYQHLPHLAVVLLHRLLLQQVSLLTVFNVVRYVLLVGFPVTMY